jgi:fructose-bisphosphate aldolase, class I
MSELAKIARAMVAKGKGILAADESTGTIEKRFNSINVTNTEENRRAYREMLFTGKGIGQHISGVILYDETIHQKCADGTSFVDAMNRQGILPGIKVDTGAKDMALCPGETITEGLDGLGKRLADYRKIGARFAKWRAVITIGNGIPSSACIEANAHALARYAALCQANDIVPIVEPEVLMDGSHTIDTCEWVTEVTLRTVFPRVGESARAARRHCVEAFDDDLRQRLQAASESSRSRCAHHRSAKAHGTRCGARHRVPLRWSRR